MEQPYRLLYLVGLTPWDNEEVPGPLSALADELSGASGQALDLGCGTGRDAVYLASRGWTVTAVDGVPRAIERGRRRAQNAGVEVSWVLGDVTRLQSSGIGEGHQLVLDRGCFHGLSEGGRQRYANGVTSAAAPNAQLLLYAFQPRRLGLGPPGVSPDGLRHYFNDSWELASSVTDNEPRLPWWLGDARPTWYRFRRRA